MNNQFQPLLIENSVILLKENSPDNLFVSQNIFKKEDLLEAMILKLLAVSSMKKLEEDYFKPRKKWIADGLKCELLQPHDPYLFEKKLLWV
jgi:hypothetical protein